MTIYYKEPKLKEKYLDLVKEIIDELQNGDIPWRKPWIIKLPTNLKTKKNYNGINILNLQSQARRNEYRSHFWITQRQAFSLKGRIKKEEISKPSFIILSKWVIQKRSSKKSDKKYLNAWLMMRQYPVYNLDQTTGLKSNTRTEQISL